MKLYKTVEMNCPVQSFESELKAVFEAIEASGQKHDALRAKYWLQQLEKGELPDIAQDALWAGVRVGAAFERANAERAWAEPIRKQVKAKTDRIQAQEKGRQKRAEKIKSQEEADRSTILNNKRFRDICSALKRLRKPISRQSIIANVKKYYPGKSPSELFEVDIESRRGRKILQSAIRICKS